MSIKLVDKRLPQFELIPIGLYDGSELLPGTMILDDSYIVYMQVPSLEYDYEVIFQ